jgi:quercetin dioxygenase-like cupin family protein
VCLTAVVLAIFEMVLASSAAAAITTYSSSALRQTIERATVSDRNDEPLYFAIRSGTLAPGKTQEVNDGDGIYYQSSGTVKINIAGRVTTLTMGDGIFIPAGTPFTLEANRAGPSSTYLQFLLTPATDPETAQSSVASAEVYRSPSPIPGLMLENNLLTLSRVPVPPESPCDPLHQRSGAALHYILAGLGAEFTENWAKARGPGSVSFEPQGLVYQWSNPGSKPLVYLVFNVSPQGVPPIVQVDYATDPFSANAHITWAIYCVALSMALTLLVSATTTIGHGQKPGERPGKR